MSRLFTYGCSFTSFCWPTWADIVADTYIRNEVITNTYNYGWPGNSNKGILFALASAHETYDITSDDINMVMWTSWHRATKYNYENRVYTAGGAVFTSDIFKSEDRFKDWTIWNDIVENFTVINSANRAYHLDFQGEIHEATGPQILDELELGCSDKEKELFLEINHNPLRKTLNQVQDTSLIWIDNHPTVIDHLDYVETVMGIHPHKETKKNALKIWQILVDEFSPLNQDIADNRLGSDKAPTADEYKEMSTRGNELMKMYFPHSHHSEYSYACNVDSIATLVKKTRSLFE